MNDSFASPGKIQAREVAYTAVEKLKPESTSVIEYQSRGHVVVIGDSKALKLFGDLPKGLSSEVVEFKGQIPSSDISIAGALGQFVVTVANQEIKGDLVLDLSPEPLLAMGIKPPGYVVADLDSSNLQTVKNELADMVGTFEKPKYFNYDASACAHGRSGKPGCTRCIDACPAEAITSLIDMIKVDPTRCQGGGICATVCPSGAITYAYPQPKDMLTHVRTLILTYLKQGETSPDLVFVTEAEQKQAEQILPAALVISVEEVASVGPEVWLSALAWGARSIRIFDLGDSAGNNRIPQSSRDALDLHLEMTQDILSASGYPASAILVITDPSELITSKTMPEFELATHAPITKKRQAFYMALDHLVAKSADAKPSTTLPQGSIFGDVEVNKDNCTLCMACVSACPANALQDSSEKPMLSLVEANCLQCGVCVNTCPESAMSLTPRLILDFEVRKKPRLLNEEEPFCCISCGTPFATKSGITTILEKLSGHSMFADERSKSRLKMCEDCRVRDMMEDPNSDL
ncbi:MAG TPA: 4Fe-4S dicluster domain-containing protein [Leucothrix sp.]|nr:4Fe-4S dicluster domain-containing protein [Leucothrix sp.]